MGEIGENARNVNDNEFNQKKINHIVHYTKHFDILINILKNGFAPSYCLEDINNFKCYIPMVSFCNIPLNEVDKYLYYGEYGIGMSLEWAIKNSVSPVVYIHESTPFGNNFELLQKLNVFEMFNEICNKGSVTFEKFENNVRNYNYDNHEEKSKRLNEIEILAVQFYKNWKTIHENKEIITYQEREWRYIPKLKKGKIIPENDIDFKTIESKKKPHLPNNGIKFTIENIRYILIKNESQRELILNILIDIFGGPNVIKSILSGKLMIFTKELIHNDF